MATGPEMLLNAALKLILPYMGVTPDDVQKLIIEFRGKVQHVVTKFDDIDARLARIEARLNIEEIRAFPAIEENKDAAE